jgi:hypothetical protein
MDNSTMTIGSRVEGGDIVDDYDTGTVVAISGDQLEVAWDSGVRTTQPAAILRSEGERRFYRQLYDPSPWDIVLNGGDRHEILDAMNPDYVRDHYADAMASAVELLRDAEDHRAR